MRKVETEELPKVGGGVTEGPDGKGCTDGIKEIGPVDGPTTGPQMPDGLGG